MIINRCYSLSVFLEQLRLSRSFLVFICLVLYCLPIQAQGNNGKWFYGFLDKCHAIENSNLRLECYDALAEITRKRESKDSNFSSPPNQALTKNSTNEKFGFASKLNEENKKAVKISIKAKVVKVSELKRNLKIFYFDNGQIWKQSKADYISIPKNKEFDVIISKGAIGDYRLRVNGKGKMTRVKRIN